MVKKQLPPFPYVTDYWQDETILCLQEPDDLFETASQALLNAVDRDAVSGWGAVVHIM